MRRIRLIDIETTIAQILDAATGEPIEGDWTLDSQFNPLTFMIDWTLTTERGPEAVAVVELRMSPESVGIWNALVQSAIDNPDTPDDVRERLRED